MSAQTNGNRVIIRVVRYYRSTTSLSIRASTYYITRRVNWPWNRIRAIVHGVRKKCRSCCVGIYVRWTRGHPACTATGTISHFRRRSSRKRKRRIRNGIKRMKRTNINIHKAWKTEIKRKDGVRCIGLCTGNYLDRDILEKDSAKVKTYFAIRSRIEFRIRLFFYTLKIFPKNLTVGEGKILIIIMDGSSVNCRRIAKYRY